MFNATLNNISVTVYHGRQFYWLRKREKIRLVASHRQTLSHNVVWSIPRISGDRQIAQVVVNPTTI